MPRRRFDIDKIRLLKELLDDLEAMREEDRRRKLEECDRRHRPRVERALNRLWLRWYRWKHGPLPQGIHDWWTEPFRRGELVARDSGLAAKMERLWQDIKLGPAPDLIYVGDVAWENQTQNRSFFGIVRRIERFSGRCISRVWKALPRMVPRARRYRSSALYGPAWRN